MHKSYVLRNGKLVEKSKAPPKSGAFIMPDIAPFTTHDGKEISSRSNLRAYEQANGVKQVGNDEATLHRALRAKVYGEHQ